MISVADVVAVDVVIIVVVVFAIVVIVVDAAALAPMITSIRLILTINHVFKY